jgi:Cu/Ag efflux protein CusF
MTKGTATALALGLCLLGTGAAVQAAAQTAAQKPLTASKSVTGTATIQAIDSTRRMITLRFKDGQEDSFEVGKEVQRFNELKVGDTVKMTYTESVVVLLRKPGDPPITDAQAANAATTRGTGALPSATMAAQERVTVTVKAIDPATQAITVTTKDGRTVTRKVDDKKFIDGLKAGQTIDIVYTRALVTAIERGQ